MGPRPFGRGRIGAGRPAGVFAELQWGRDLSVAEGPKPKAPAACIPLASMGPRPFGRGRDMLCGKLGRRRLWLQWGRDLSVAEGALASILIEANSVLQWGRDLSVAEGPSRARRTRRRAPGFNGAATFRSRKDAGPRNGRQPSTRFNGAATFRSRKGAHARPAGARRLASMGPRPFGRGRPA